MERAKEDRRFSRNYTWWRPNCYICPANIGMSIHASRHKTTFRSMHSTLASWGERPFCFVLAFLSCPQTKPREVIVMHGSEWPRSPRRSLRPPNRFCRASCSQSNGPASWLFTDDCPYSQLTCASSPLRYHLWNEPHSRHGLHTSPPPHQFRSAMEHFANRTKIRPDDKSQIRR
jgi:hypothetical protein